VGSQGVLATVVFQKGVLRPYFGGFSPPNLPGPVLAVGEVGVEQVDDHGIPDIGRRRPRSEAGGAGSDAGLMRRRGHADAEVERKVSKTDIPPQCRRERAKSNRTGKSWGPMG
jgi:hypothetical protein